MAAYGTDQGFQDWLDLYGYVLPLGAPSLAILRARGSAYIDATYEPLWTGVRTGGIVQELGWPRSGAVLNCTSPIPDDVIPTAVVNAAYRAAYLVATVGDIGGGGGSVGSGRVKRQKVDVIEREFFDDGVTQAGSAGPSYLDPEIDGALRAFICDGGESMATFIWSVG